MTKLRAKRIEEAKQAITNLERAIKDLEDDGASEASIKRYRDELGSWRAKLNKLT